MCAPVPEDPQDAQVASMYMKDIKLFNETAKHWVDEYANVNGIKTDFFEGKVRAYAKGAVIEDDL